MTEAQIISKAIKNNKLAIEQLYHSYQSGWFMICLRYNSNKEDALDVLQNALIKVFTNLKKFDIDKGSFKSWSSKIVVNESLMFLRSKKNFYNTFELNEEMKIYNSEQSALDYLSAEELTKMIQKLPTGYRTVFNLYVVEGYSHKEIATMIGISEGTSKSQLFKAKKLLKVNLEVLL